MAIKATQVQELWVESRILAALHKYSLILPWTKTTKLQQLILKYKYGKTNLCSNIMIEEEIFET